MVDVYRIKGSFGEKLNKQVFTIDVRATKPENAREQVYADIGSKHGAKRRLIHIEDVSVIPAEETKSLLVKQIMESE